MNLLAETLFRVLIKPNFYRDSLQLMKISDRVRHISTDVLEASVIMATQTNKDILIRLGFRPSEVELAGESDVLIAVRAHDQKSIDSAFAEANRLLESPESLSGGGGAAKKAADLDSALTAMPDANLILISVPGEFVKGLSLKLTSLGIHQQIFSDHVAVEDEFEIKSEAAKKGVLILGPGAGTSIINGRGIGFSNVIETGPVGIVAAAGTGLQEVTALLDHCNIGVMHGLGVGGNDPRDKIGGLMMLESLKLLEQIEGLDVIGIVSKPPSPSVHEKIISYVNNKSRKKYVLAFIGGKRTNTGQGSVGTSRVVQVSTLASSVLAIARHLGGRLFSEAVRETFVPARDLLARLEGEWNKLGSGQKYIRALYTGGTFTYEAQVILNDMLKDEIFSNAPILNVKQLADSFKSEAHSIVDLGEEEFTSGRPHPMIDPTIRKFRILEEAKDHSVAVLLMDFVLGYGSHADPVGAALNEIKQARELAEKDGRHLCIVSHVCGSRNDPQGYGHSVERLESAGAIVLPTNALAAVASATVALRGNIDLERIYSQYLTLEGSEME